MEETGNDGLKTAFLSLYLGAQKTQLYYETSNRGLQFPKAETGFVKNETSENAKDADEKLATRYTV